jgi:mono/diheme cytochrome c family protein
VFLSEGKRHESSDDLDCHLDVDCRATAVSAQDLGDKTKGRIFAQAVCAECHAVNPSDTASPRTDAAPFKAIAVTPGMTELALAVWLKTPHKTMPNLIIGNDDMENVIAYIVSLRGK